MTTFRAVGNKIALHMGSLKLPLSCLEALGVLTSQGFRVIDTDIVALAKTYIGIAEYRRGARVSEAPYVFDCSSFMKWLYGTCGVWLPRRTIQQRIHGHDTTLSQARSGDLIFTTGHIDYFHRDPRSGVGHVGMVSHGNTVIHAANRTRGIVEDSFLRYFMKRELRCIRRICDFTSGQFFTLECPKGWEIETSDDLRWIILQKM